ncbi:MAG: tetratricopeptide repeat protein [Gammaproteobacteria bacterium]|nr:tetratricopeptide repeat protein [Gammaproteobacteria bacterium]
MVNYGKTQPIFATGLTNPMSAMAYFTKAQQAFAGNQWQQAYTLAQAAASAAKNDKAILYSAQNVMAAALLRLNKIEGALALWIELNSKLPNNGQILSNIGFVLTEIHRYQEAAQYLEQAIKVAPQDPVAHLNLGYAYSKLGNTKQAKLHYLHSSQLNPKYAKAKFLLGDVLQEEGLTEEALVAYKQGFELDPHNLTYLNNAIFVQHALYPPNLEQYMKFVHQFAQAIDLQTPKVTSKQIGKPHTPLRIGIVSADFYQHVVCYFIENVLSQIKNDEQLRDRLTLVAYSNQSVEDEATRRLQGHFDLWRKVNELNDDALAEQIKQDEIDILIDLSGHTKDNRLPVFARKAAPLQVSWLGYWGTTGLTSIDYVLADPISVPANEEYLFIEKIWRLPHLRYCVSTLKDAPEVSPPPCTSNQHITFGCYQFTRKINQGVLHCWAQILAACPQARLRVQSFSLDKTELKEQFIQRLIAANIDPNRVELIGGITYSEYLESYANIDIVLDTFPYPGGTTTAQALWMGVPTITLATTGMLGRQGEALLINAGLTDWVAYSEQEYVQKAIAWGNANTQKRDELTALRMNLRTQVAKTPIFDAQTFAINFVDSLYAMWDEKSQQINIS